MRQDLSGFLEAWPYDSDRTVRMIRGADGRRKVQVRLPLGVEQYELDGRPDGLRPKGCRSLLRYWEKRLGTHRRRHGSDENFLLPTDACEGLREEAILYYYRYLLLFQIGEYGRCARDTARNLRCLDLVSRYGETEEDRDSLEQYRAYIVRMNRASRALLAVGRRQYNVALGELKAGIRQIEALEEGEPAHSIEKRRSLAFLRQMAEEVRRKKPLSPRERLERTLQRAVAEENYELAAEIRDRLRDIDEAT
jgi:hypothetical protein